MPNILIYRSLHVVNLPLTFHFTSLKVIVTFTASEVGTCFKVKQKGLWQAENTEPTQRLLWVLKIKQELYFKTLNKRFLFHNQMAVIYCLQVAIASKTLCYFFFSTA